ncbi:MAG: ABC transporter substrate-binding protein [Rhodoferax sp.]
MHNGWQIAQQGGLNLNLLKEFMNTKKQWLCLFVGALLWGAMQFGYAAEDKADEAVKAAQKYRGQTLNVTWNKGLMAKEVLLYSGPLWEKLTGIKINVVEHMIGDMYPVVESEFFKKSGAFDLINIVPSSLPDYVELGAVEPLQPYLTKYDYAQELEDIGTSFKNNWMKWNGKVYTIPDDGDVLTLYYRRDLFEDTANRTAFKKKYGYELAPPTTWKQFDEISAFFTNKYAPALYGSAMMHDSLSFYFFEERFRVNGGRFFDEKTMKTTINSPIGKKTLRELVERIKTMPPGAGKWGFMDVLSAFVDGKLAMTEFWPPMGRWAEGYGTDTEQLSWVPKSKVVGKVGYALPPGGYSGMAAGFGLSISSQSKNKEAAYLFIQWLTSKKISLERVQIPYSLRDPYRISHYQSTEYRGRWPNAPQYLDTLAKASNTGMPDLFLYQINRYERVLTEGLNAAFVGEVSPEAALDKVAASWDGLTRAVGVDKQRTIYKSWAARPNAYPK